MGLVAGLPANASTEVLALGAGPCPWPDLAGARRSLEGRSASVPPTEGFIGDRFVGTMKRGLRAARGPAAHVLPVDRPCCHLATMTHSASSRRSRPAAVLCATATTVAVSLAPVSAAQAVTFIEAHATVEAVAGFRVNNPNVAEACGCGESIKFKDQPAA